MEDETKATVTILGGPDDGLVVSTDDPEHMSSVLTEFVCLATEFGKKMAHVIQGYSPAGLNAVMMERFPGQANKMGFSFNHKYKVVGRSVEGGRVYIRMEYVSNE